MERKKAKVASASKEAESSGGLLGGLVSRVDIKAGQSTQRAPAGRIKHTKTDPQVSLLLTQEIFSIQLT